MWFVSRSCYLKHFLFGLINLYHSSSLNVKKNDIGVRPQAPLLYFRLKDDIKEQFPPECLLHHVAGNRQK